MTEQTAETERVNESCLVTCITTDDKGRGYYCEWCPERVTPPGKTE